ncbi:MAG: hypothetical protein ACRCT8_12245 [Lacipirellulaceae bacterium]
MSAAIGESLNAAAELGELFAAANAEAFRDTSADILQWNLLQVYALWPSVLDAAQRVGRQENGVEEFYRCRHALHGPLAIVRICCETLDRRDPDLAAAAAHSPGARDSRESAASRHPSDPQLAAIARENEAFTADSMAYALDSHAKGLRSADEAKPSVEQPPAQGETSDRPAELRTESQRDVVKVLGDGPARSTADVLDKLANAGFIHGEATVKATLAELKRSGVLAPANASNGYGYKLVKPV